MITSARYLESGFIEFVYGGGTHICPNDMANRDRKRVAQWVASGNVITPYTPVAGNYSIASKLGVMRYLKDTGEWIQVKTLLSNNEDAKDEWDAASELHIDDPTLIAMSQALGWDSTKLQTIFNAVAE